MCGDYMQRAFSKYGFAVDRVHSDPMWISKCINEIKPNIMSGAQKFIPWIAQTHNKPWSWISECGSSVNPAPRNHL